MINLTYILLGIFAGIFAGFLGLGGGIVLIPILVYGYGLTQHQAQGTSLAIMVPPITLLAAIRYYYSGNVKVGMAVLIACGFVAGGLLGAHLVQRVPDVLLRKIFGLAMLVVSLRMILFK
ncbi:MAG: sulfite exporter TauE/SafE family protein [Candidatus Omnitrophica bacterium]|nr:sulfite exporter TauE/SafE family protein [Candidatus Omnitrophota bacterium]MCM8790263.1 sulfite exporter TauE/SafE family protein [Candidatus Omnitrophota bacterium]